MTNGHGRFQISWEETDPNGPTTDKQASVGTGGISTLPPDAFVWVIDGLGYAYTITSDYKLARLNQNDTQAWTSGSLGSSVQILSTRADGGVDVLDSDGHVRRYDSDGTQLDPEPDASTPVMPPGVLIGEQAFAGESDAISAYSVDDSLWGVWQTPAAGNPAKQAAGPGPTLTVSSKSITRGKDLVTFRVLGAQSQQDWSFIPSTHAIRTIIRTFNDQTPTWQGYMAIGGTAHVHVTVGSKTTELATKIDVKPRTDGWKSTAKPAEKKDNGTNGFNMPDPPPLPSPGLKRPLGLSILQVAIANNYQPLVVQDQGPNSGLEYVGQASDATTYWYAVLHALEAPTSEFYVSQWGTFDPNTNPRGYISGARLLQGVLDHEAGATGQSHYMFYTKGLDSRDSNILVATEKIVAWVDDFGDVLNQAIQDTSTRLDNRFHVEPCNGGIDEFGMFYDSANDCTPIGKVNMPPYVPHP